jgi:hypothetical protein
MVSYKDREISKFYIHAPTSTFKLFFPFYVKHYQNYTHGGYWPVLSNKINHSSSEFWVLSFCTHPLGNQVLKYKIPLEYYPLDL